MKGYSIDSSRRHLSFSLKREKKKIDEKSCEREVIADSIGYLNFQQICKKKPCWFHCSNQKDDGERKYFQ